MAEVRGARVAFEGVSVERGPLRALDAVDLVIEPGELLVVVGPSGCGKSTLLKLVNRLLAPTSGRVTLDGQDVRERPPIELRRSVGYCFQALGLFPHLTVAENVGIGLRLVGKQRAEIERRVDQLLERVRLDARSMRHRLPAELSGGQAQRVAVARALATRPPVLLLDEPFGALDPETRAQIQDELLDVCRDEGATTMLVSHDMGEALVLGRRVAVLHGGKLLRVAPPEDLLRDAGDERIDALLEPARRAAKRIVALGRERRPA